MITRIPFTSVLSVLALALVACGGPEGGSGEGAPPGADPNDGYVVNGRIEGRSVGSGTVEARDRGSFFFPSGGGGVTRLATGTLEADGSFAVTLPEVPEGAITSIEKDDVSVFRCDATALDVAPVGVGVLHAAFEVAGGDKLAYGVQQGDSTLFVTPEPDDLRVFHVYAEEAVSIRGSESCPAIPFHLEYDLDFVEGWNVFTATFVSETDALNYRIETGEVPAEAVWFESD